MSASIYFKNSVRFVSVDGDVNMANANARSFLAVLGFSTDFENDAALPIAEFHAALVRYQASEIASVVDGGTATVAVTGEQGCIEVWCGRRSGYLSEKVAAALQLTVEAMDKGATHVYLA